jgi:hypothetical protein
MAYYSTEIGGAIDATHVYYNISVTNDNYGAFADASGNIVENSTDKSNNQPLVFNETRVAPYLVNPEEHYMSIMDFSVESPTLPVFIAQPILGAKRDSTIYTITLISNNVIRQSPVIWYPQDLSVPKPQSIITQNNDIVNPYYYCYSYQHFINCINRTLEDLANSSGLSYAPYLEFDPITNLITIAGNVTIYRTASDGTLLGTGTKCAIYFNSELANLLESLPVVYVANKLGNNIDYQVLLSTGSDVLGAQPFIVNVRRNKISKIDVYATQEFSSIAYWSPVKSIVFKTSLLNVVPEVIATPVIYGQDNNTYSTSQIAVPGSSNYISTSYSNNQNAEVLNVLIDHIVPQITGTEYKPYIFYEPTGEYRLTSLYGKVPINQIDISVFWKNFRGDLIPFTLGIGCVASIKILFRKKYFNSPEL